MKIAIYAEHCILAGMQCTDQELIESGSDDIVMYEGDTIELSEIANRIERYNARGNLYKNKTVETIRNNLMWE